MSTYRSSGLDLGPACQNFNDPGQNEETPYDVPDHADPAESPTS